MCMCVICIFVITAVDIDGADNEPSYTDTKNVMKQTPDNTIDADGPDGVSTQPDKKPKKVKKRSHQKEETKGTRSAKIRLEHIITLILL